MRPISLGFVLTGLLSIISFSGFSQANPVNNAPPATYDPSYAIPYIRHETDGQNQILIPLDANLGATYSCVGASCSGWTVNVGGAPATVSSVIGAAGSSTVIVNLDGPSPVIKVGETVTVSYTGGGGINAFAGLTSYNARPLTCSDFQFQALNGDTPPCAPVSPINTMTFSIKAGARNSSRFDFDDFVGTILWGSGGSVSNINEYESDAVGTPATDSYFITVDASISNFTYPSTDLVCGYSSTWRIRFNSGGSCPPSSASQTVPYNSYNTDAAGEGDGSLALEPTIANTNRVCEGEFVNMSFSDVSDLNCIDVAAAPPPFSLNQDKRWVRIIYGFPHTPGNTIPNVVVNGVAVTDVNGDLLIPGGYIPTSANALGNPDPFGVVEFPSAVTGPAGELEEITTSSPTPIGSAGKQFYITMQYWNTCNAYSIGDFSNARTTEDYIEVITSPVEPNVTPLVNNRCETDANNAFEFTATRTQAGSRLDWYSDAALSDLEKSSVTAATFNPTTEGSPLLTKSTTNTTRTIKYYVTETFMSGPSSGCTSPPREITINITDSNDGGTIDHPNETGTTQVVAICSGDNPPAFTSPEDASGGDGITYVYLWERSTTGPGGPYAAAPGTNNGVTYDPPALTQTTWFRRRVSSGNCTDAFSNIFQFRVDTPVIPGSINGGETICLTADPSNMGNASSPTGGDGANYSFQWEMSTTSILGPFNTIGGATANTYDPGGVGALTQTTYFRRRVTSGVCIADGNGDSNPDNVAYSNVITKTVHQLVDPGLIDNPQVICENDDPTTLISTMGASGGDGVNYAYQWEQSTTSAIAGFSDIGSATSASYDPPPLSETTWFRRRASSGVCDDAITTAIEITVNELPTAEISGGGSICQGTAAPPVEIALTGIGPWSLVYAIDGVPQPPELVTTSPFQIINPAGDSDGTAYSIVSVSDANTPTCTVTAPHANIDNTANVEVIDIAIPPPAVEPGGFTAGTAVCDNGATTNPPDAFLNLLPDQIETYRISYQLRQISTNITGPVIGPADFTSDANGEITISPTYAQMGGAPDYQGYQIIIISIFNITTGCAGAVPINGPTLIVNPNPTINTQPSDDAVCVGGTATFSVDASVSGSALVYQWQESTDGVSWNPISNGTTGGVTYSGTDTDELSISDVTIGMHNYEYRVVVGAFTGGACTTTSAEVALTVNAYPVISDQPDNADQCIGLSQSFTVAATGPGIQYRWQQDPDGAGAAPYADLSNGTTGGVTYSGATTTSLTLANITAALDESTYRVRITSTGSCSIESDPAELIVNPLPTVNVITPVLCDETPGLPLRVNAVTLSDYNGDVTDAPTGNVTWYSDAARTAIFLVTTPAIDHGDIFYWHATSVDGCENIGQVTFTVEDLPDAVDKSYAFCEDGVNAGVASNINLTLLEFGAGGVTDGDGTAANRDVVWFTDVGLTSPVSDDTDFQISATTVVYAQVINTSSAATTDCFDVAEVTLVYKQVPVNNPISGDAALCSGPGVKVYSVNSLTNNYGTDHDYAWTITGTDNFEVFETGTGFTTTNSYTITTSDNLIIVIFPNAGIFDFEVQEIIDGCSGDINTYQVSVTGAPAALALAPTTPTQVCKDQTGVTYSLSTAPNGGSVYTWTVIGGNVVGASSGLGLGTITVNWGSITSPQPSVSVTETNGNGCSGAPASVNITFNDVPEITSANTTNICSGTTPNSIVPFTADIGGTSCTSCTFSWKIVNSTANVTIGGASVPVFPALGSTGNGQIPHALTNTSGVTGTVIYEVTATENDSPNPPTCASVTEIFTVTVLPEPVVTAVSNVVVCSGEPISAINFTGNVGGETFTWTNDNTAIGLSAGSTGNIGAFTAGNNFTAGDIIGNITVAATKNGCTSAGTNSKQFTITIKPEPVYDNSNPTICSGDPVGIDLHTLENGVGLNATSFNITNINSNGLTPPVTNSVVGTGYDELVISNDTWINTTNNPVNVIYTIVPLTGTCLGDPFQVTVTVTPEPVYNDATPTRCSDEIVGINLSGLKAGTSVTATDFNITIIDGNGLTPGASNAIVANGVGGTGILNDTWTNTTALPVDVEYTIVPVNGTCLGEAFTVTVTVNPEPVYDDSTPTICSDEIVNIDLGTLKEPTSVVATAFNININNGGLTPGAGNAIAGNGLTAAAIVNDTWTNITANPVDVVYTITPVNGTCLGTPFVITVTVNPEPAYDTETKTVCSDEVVGVDLSTLKNDPSGVNATTFNITGIIDNGLTAGTGNSAVGTGFNQLVISNDTWTNTTNANVNVVYTIVPVTGTCPGTPFTVTITVTPEPVYNNSTPTICSDEIVGINLSALKAVSSVTATAFNITNVDNNGLTPGATNASVANGLNAAAIANDTWTNTTALPVDVEYTIIPVNGTCLGEAFTVTVTVDPEPTYNDAASTICSDEIVNIDLTTLKSATSVTATTFNIAIVDNGLTAGAGNVTAANGLAATAIVNDTWTNTTANPVDVEYTITPVNGVCLGEPFVITVTVEPEPVYDLETKTVCSDEVIGIDLSTLKNGAGVTATTFNITSINNNGLIPGVGNSAVGNGVGNLEISADTWTNTTNLPVDVIYTVVPVAGSCAGTPFTVTVTVTPEPVYNSSTPTRCSDEIVNINLSSLKVGSSVAATTFNIAINDGGLTPGASNVSAGNGLAVTAIVNDSWTNTTALPVDVVYTIVPVNGTCLGTPFIVTVTVNPEPVYDNASPTLCSNELLNIDLSDLKNGTGVDATGYNITIAANGLTASAGSPANGINLSELEISNDSWTNTTANPVNVVYTIIPVAGTCQGSAFTVTVTVNPEPVYSNSTSVLCSDEQVNIDLSTLKGVGSVTATTFNIAGIVNNGLSASAGTPAIVNGVGNLEISDDRWTNTSLIPVDVIYTIVPVNGTCQGIPFTITVTVNPEPVGATTPFIKCNEEQFNLNLISVMSPASILPSTYNISVTSNGLTFAGTTNSHGTGKTATELFDDRWINTTPNPVDVVYDITPISSSNCLGTTFTLTFTINPKPTSPAITTASICSDGTFNFDLQTVVDNSIGGGNSVPSAFKYTVSSSNPAVSTAAPRNIPSDAVINDVYENKSNTDAIITYLVTPISDLGCEGSTFEVRLTVFPEPVGIDIVDTECITVLNHNIQAEHIDAIGGNSLPAIFTYTVSSSDPVEVAPGSDRTLASNANITDNYINTSGADVTITYTITPFNSANPACPGTPFTYQVVISSRPVGDPSTAAAVCSDVNFSIDPQNNINNGVTSTFSWTVTYDTGLTGPFSGSGSNITGTLTNNTSGVKNARYEVTPTSGSCAGVSFTITLPINPEPVIDPSVTPRTICSDTPTNILLGALGGSETPDIYDIALVSQDPDLIGTPTTGLGLPDNAIENDSYTNNSRTNGLLVIYSVTPYGPAGLGGCQGNALSVQIEVLPEPVMDPALANVSICSDVANNIQLSSDGISVNASTYFINAITVQSTGTAITPGITVADVTSPLGNIEADPSTVTGARNNNFIRNDKFTVVNADGANNNNTVVYNVTPESGAGCFGDAFDINLLVLPEPQFDPVAPPPVCSDQTIDLELIQRDPTSTAIAQYNVTGITWQNGLLPGGTNIPIGQVLTADGNGDFIDINDVFTNSSAVSLTATYSIKPIAVASLGQSCEGDVVDAVVTIRPSPLVLDNLDKIVCNDAINGIAIGTEVTSAPAQSFEITRNPLIAGLSPGAYSPGTQLIDGATTNSIASDHVVNNTNNPLAVTYTIRANTDPGGSGCYGPAETITVTVEPPLIVDLSGPPGNTNNAKPNICSADDTEITLTSPSNPSSGNVTFNFTASSGVPGVVSGLSPGANLDEGDIIEQVLSNSSNSPVDVTYTVTPRANSAAGGDGCIGDPFTTVVSVEPKPRLAATPASITVCEGVPLGIDLSSVTVPSTGAASVFYQLTAVEDPNTLALPVNVSGFGTTYPANYTSGTDALNDILDNTSTSQQTVRYLFTPSFTLPTGTCTGDPVSINVTVNPRPVLLPFTVEPKCSGEAFSQDFSASVTEVDLSSTLTTWTFDYTPAGDPDLKGASNGAGFELSQVIFNKNPDPATVTYSIKAKSFTCESNTLNIPVEVYPTPVITGVPNSVNVCNGGLLNTPLTSNATNTLFTWAVDDESQPDLSGATDQNTPVAGPLNFTLNNTSIVPGSYAFEITPRVATSLAGKVCVGDPFTMVVNVSPPLDGSIAMADETAESFICEGSQEFLFLEFDGLPLFDVVYREGTNTVNLTNQGAFKPIQVAPTETTEYELISVTDAFGCTVTINETVTVNVYRGVNAEFEEGVIPPFEAGSTTVTFTNTSTPFDNSEFRYEWTFGANATPGEFTGGDSAIPIEYTLPGLKEVTLKATNILAEANGLVCADSYTKTIEILLPPLTAAFRVVPLAGCFPVDIEVTENTSTGDTFKWQVIDQSGNIAATALTPKPIFRIVNPGTYDVFLESSSSITGQTAFAQINGIEVFDNPIASLEARPTTLFIPDTELITFNFSTGANFYQWDFDDGTLSADFEPKHLYTLEGTYQITLVAGYDHGEKDIDGDGFLDGNITCYDTARREIVARQGGFTKVPNAFTPNPNGSTGGGNAGSGSFNDVFLPIAKGVAREDGAFVMQIYDRWGTLMFESRNQNQGWDGYDRNGNLVPAGVYVYKLDLRLADGQRTTQVGDVTVIR